VMDGAAVRDSAPLPLSGISVFKLGTKLPVCRCYEPSGPTELLKYFR
jgi:hypothetical protein